MTTSKKDWVVTTSGDRPLDDVAKDLQQSGFKVAQLHHEINLISVEGDAAAAEKAREVKGVTDVSANVGADVGPPGST